MSSEMHVPWGNEWISVVVSYANAMFMQKLYVTTPSSHPSWRVHRCTSCAEGDEQYCENGATFTYNSDETNVAGVKTRGGYADHVVVDQKCASGPPNAQPRPWPSF